MTAAKASSPRISDKRRQNRLQILCTLLFTAIVVMAMTWYDLHVRSYAPRQQPPIENYFVRADSDQTLLPDDYSTLTLDQGAPPGMAAGQENSVPLANYPQRQVDLYFTLSALPDSTNQQAVIDGITKLAETWGSKSNIVSDLIFDVRDLDTPIAEVLEFITALRNSQKFEYRTAVVVDPLAASSQSLSGSNERKVTNVYVYLPAEGAEAVIAAADRFQLPFYGIVDAGTDVKTFQAEAAGRAKFFRGFIVAVPPAATKAPEPAK